MTDWAPARGASPPSRGTTGIVLAGGASTRFAAADGSSKLDADLGGRSVLAWTVRAVAAVCWRIVVAGRAGPGDAFVTYVPDTSPGQGPLAGLVAGLEAADGDLAVVVGGDMPLIPPPLLRAMCQRLADDPAATAAVLRDGEVWRPLPLVVRRQAALPAAREAMVAGRRALRDIVGAMAVATIDEPEWRRPDPSARWRLDIDRPEDLDRARRWIAAADGGPVGS